jgi:hypothetical protein
MKHVQIFCWKYIECKTESKTRLHLATVIEIRILSEVISGLVCFFVSQKRKIFWDVRLCRLTEVHRYFAVT